MFDCLVIKIKLVVNLETVEIQKPTRAEVSINSWQ